MKPNTPIHKLNDGLIVASIWRNDTDDGKARYNVTFARSYLKDEQWETAYSFSGAELLRLARLSEQAFDWIKLQRGTQASSEAA